MNRPDIERLKTAAREADARSWFLPSTILALCDHVERLERENAAYTDKDHPDFIEAVDQRIIDLDAEAIAFERELIKTATQIAERCSVETQDGWSAGDLYDAIAEDYDAMTATVERLESQIERARTAGDAIKAHHILRGDDDG